MRIAIVGPSWGSGLGSMFAHAGHTVVFASHDLDRARSAAAQAGDGVRAANVLPAVDQSEVVVMVVPFDRYPDVAREAAEVLQGKVVVDTSSPINWRGEQPEIFTVPNGLSGAQHQQLAMSPAKVVKAFNYIYGTGNLAALASRVGYERVAVPLAADDRGAKKTVANLIKSVGFVPVDVGGLADAHVIEPSTFDDWLQPMTETETRKRITAKRGIAMK